MLMRFLNKTGYTKVRQRGSHIRYKHLHRPTITLNVTGKKVIKPGRLHGLIKEMGMNKTDFFEFFHIQAKA
jgi:predicted RNA binding protein YcfA (HicA-like mRNA interferase family)